MSWQTSDLTALESLYAQLASVRRSQSKGDDSASPAPSTSSPEVGAAPRGAKRVSSSSPVLILSRCLPFDFAESNEEAGVFEVLRSPSSHLSDLSDALCSFQSDVRSGTRGEGTACLWIGWGGSELDKLSTSETEQMRPVWTAKHGIYPVELTSPQHALFYDGYCKSILWPVLHNNAPTRSWSQGLGITRTLSLDHFQWDAYSAANQAFADTVQEACIENCYASDPIVWIHGYHLMLTPLMVRAKLPRARIGFFLHQPFCSSELFRVLPRRLDIIRGLLAADLIGFQTFRSASHFRRTCQRLLSVESTAEGIVYNGRFVHICISPIGINPERYIGAVRSDEVQRRIEQLQEQLLGDTYAYTEKISKVSIASKLPPAVPAAGAGAGGRIGGGASPREPGSSSSSSSSSSSFSKQGRRMVLLGIDAPDSVKGVEHKFMAYERLLSQHPELQGRVVFVQVTLTARYSNLDSSQSQGSESSAALAFGPQSQAFASQVARANKQRHETVEENIDTLVGRINGKFAKPGHGRTIVHLRSLPSLDDLCALHSIADVCVVTPMVDGMNLVAATHVACRHANGACAKVVLSEFAGSASSLSGAINVNPWDVEATARALHSVLEMGSSQTRRRHEDMWSCSERFTSKFWASTFLQRLSAATQTKAVVTHSTDELLRSRTIEPHYRRARRRLIILDVEDVLLNAYEFISLTGARTTGKGKGAALTPSASGMSLSSSHVSLSSLHSAATSRVIALLEELCSDPANTVVLSTDHTKSAIESWTGVLRCALSAEGGTFFRRAPDAAKERTPSLLSSSHFIDDTTDTEEDNGFLLPGRGSPRLGGVPLGSTPGGLLLPTPVITTAVDAPPSIERAVSPLSSGSQLGGDANALPLEWDAVHEASPLAMDSPLMEILRYFTERTPGSWIEYMEAGVAWHYTSVEAVHGTWQAKELVASLLDMCDRFKLAVSRCEATKTVRMRPVACSKAHVIKVRRVFVCVSSLSRSRSLRLLCGDALHSFQCRSHHSRPPFWFSFSFSSLGHLFPPPAAAPLLFSSQRSALGGGFTTKLLRSARSPHHQAVPQLRMRSPKEGRSTFRRAAAPLMMRCPSTSCSAFSLETIRRIVMSLIFSAARGSTRRRKRQGIEMWVAPFSRRCRRNATPTHSFTATGESITFAISSKGWLGRRLSQRME